MVLVAPPSAGCSPAFPSFSARTLPLSSSARDPDPLIRYSRPRSAAELEIDDLQEYRVD